MASRTARRSLAGDSPRAYSPNLEHLSAGRLDVGGSHSPQAYSPSLEYLSTSSLPQSPFALRAASFSHPVSSSDPYEGVDNFDSVMFSSSDMDDALDDLRCPHVLDAFSVFATDGAPVSLSKVAGEARTHAILIFVPRDSVELSGLVYGKVAHLLQQAGCRLVFVSAWLPAQAATFLSRFERVAPFPGLLVCDPTAALFAHFGFTRSKLSSLISTSRFAGPRRKGIRNTLTTVSYRAQNRDIATTRIPSSRLRCGAVVLRPPSALELCEISASSFGSIVTPNIVYASQESSSSGTACHIDVLSICGVHGAFVPEIDPPHLYKRFNNMRVTCQKARLQDEKEEKMMQKKSASSKLASTPRQRTWHGN